MKPFLAVDKTNEKNNLELTGDNFKVAELPDDAFDSLDEAEEVVKALVKKKGLPRVLVYAIIINYIFTSWSLVSLVLIFMHNFLESSKTELLKNLFSEHPWLYLVCFVSIALTVFSVKYLFPNNSGVPVSAYFRAFPPLSARKQMLSGHLTSTVSVYSVRGSGINCGQKDTPPIWLNAKSGDFCHSYGNSVRTKSQGLSWNKFCTAVDKEKEFSRLSRMSLLVDLETMVFAAWQR